MRSFFSGGLRPILAILVLAGCGEEPTPTTITTVTPEPEAAPSEEPATGPEEPDPGEPASPTPSAPLAETPVPPAAPEGDLAIPRSPPLPAQTPNRAHVFVVPDEDDFDYRNEDDLTEDDRGVYAMLFIPLAARRPMEPVTVPQPTPRHVQIEFTVVYPSFRYADARLMRLVNERVSAFARAQVTAGAPGVDCAGIATTQLVSVLCAKYTNSTRSPWDQGAAGYGAMTLRIENGELRPMALADAFVPGTDLGAIFARACEGDTEEGDVHPDFLDCRPANELPERAAFTAVGVVVGADVEREWSSPGSYLVPYDALAEHLLASGPLAQSLYRRRVRTRAIEIDPSRRTAPTSTRPVWAIGPMMSPAEAAMTWLRLATPGRDAVQYVDGYLVAPSQEAALALGPAREVRVPTTARPMPLRAQSITRDAPLRIDARRTAPIARTLPRGTIVVGADALGGHTRVFATADADGYLDTRALGAAPACSPDVAIVAPSLPEAARASAPLQTLRVVTQHAGGTRAIFATELGSTIHVELHRLSAECASENAIARFDRPGARLTFLGVTHTERTAGRALLVTLDDARAPALAVHAFDRGQSIRSDVLGEGQRIAVGRSQGDAFYPVVILDAEGERVGALTWNGETLTPVP